MRFCMVTTFYPPYNFGGCGTYVRGLSRALVAQGHDVEVMHCLDAYRLKAAEPTPGEGNDELRRRGASARKPLRLAIAADHAVDWTSRTQITGDAHHSQSALRCRALSQHFARRWSRPHDPEPGAGQFVHAARPLASLPHACSLEEQFQALRSSHLLQLQHRLRDPASTMALHALG